MLNAIQLLRFYDYVWKFYLALYRIDPLAMLAKIDQFVSTLIPTVANVLCCHCHGILEPAILFE